MANKNDTCIIVLLGKNTSGIRQSLDINNTKRRVFREKDSFIEHLKSQGKKMRISV